MPTERFGDILEDVLGKEGHIDVLKIDTEGSEQARVSSISPEHLERIDRIYYETDGPEPFHGDRFDHRFDCQTDALVRRR